MHIEYGGVCRRGPHLQTRCLCICKLHLCFILMFYPIFQSLILQKTIENQGVWRIACSV